MRRVNDNLALVVFLGVWSKVVGNDDIPLTRKRSTTRRLDEKRYKFSWPECAFEDNNLSGLDCKALIESDLEENVLSGYVGVQLIRDDEEDAHLDEVSIIVNSRNEVIGKDNDGIITYPFKWNGRDVRPLNCAGLNFMQCCRTMRRRVKTNEDNEDIGCFRIKSQPQATIHKGLQDDISFAEYLYNDESKEIELTYVDGGDIKVQIFEGSDGLVHEVPYLNADLSLNPAEEIASFFAPRDNDSPLSDRSGTAAATTTTLPGISSSTMAVSGQSVNSFAQGMGDTWWYGIPLGIAIFCACSCCAFVFYMCCVPVKDEDLMKPDMMRTREGVEEIGQQSKPM